MKNNRDLYQSRYAEHATISKRLDPVIYSYESDNPLTTIELEHFDKNGYLFFPRFFTEKQMTDMVNEQNKLKMTYSLKKEPYIIREPNNEKEIRSIFEIHKTNEIFKSISKEDKLVAIVQQILEDKTYIHQSRINYKPAFRGEGFYWHSDFETWHNEDGMPKMRAVSCLITLTKNTPYNGSLMLIPGSHQFFISCIGHTPEEHYKNSLRNQKFGVPDDDSLKQMVDKFGIASPLGDAGSMLIFDCNVLHGSANNISPQSRSNLFLVYNSIKNALVAPFGGSNPRPNFIANRVAT